MCRKRYLLLFLFIIFNLNAFSTVFVVTSNADSGPGTLREALTLAAANGTTVQDYINFNLPDLSVAGRTITLENELPPISSNLIIDGSTQPGPGLNLGDARVKIAVARLQYVVSGTIGGALKLTSVVNIGIFGLDIEGFLDLKNNYLGAYILNTGILITDSENITIGAPGKGNYLGSNEYNIYDNYQSAALNNKIGNTTIQSNYFSYSPESLNDGNVIFGGDNPSEGNVLLGTFIITGYNCRISNNFMAVNRDGSLIAGGSANIQAGGKNLTINNNKANTFELELSGLDGFNIYGNTDADIANSPLTASHIDMYECSNGIIGSDDIAKQNILHGVDNTIDGISNENSSNIQLLKNSLKCIGNIPYIISNDIQNPPVIPNIQVLVNSDTEISGTCNPGALIYIYEDKSDCSACNPQIFIQTVTTNSSGIWKLNGNFANRKMLANALLNQNSSQYTTPNIDYYDYRNGIVRQPSCHQNNGVIAIGATLYVITMEWFNSNNVKVGDGFKVTGLGPGTYYAIGHNGNCKFQSGFYNLYDVEPQILDSFVSIVQPSCGIGGSITGLTATTNSTNDASFEWKDENNNSVGNEADVNDLSAGKYTLTMTDNVTKCSTTYGPVILKNTTGPNIDQTGAVVKSTNCGQSSGSIKNITVTGTGILKYSWLNSQQQQVGTDKDLVNQPAGTYKLQVTDDTQCGPLYTSEIEIPETNGIVLDESKFAEVPSSCGKNNGSVTGLEQAGGTKFTWTDATGKVAGNAIDLASVPSGDYTLIVSNAFGCSKTSAVYHIDQQASTIFPEYGFAVNEACFGSPDGSITVSPNALVKSLRWVNSAGADVGSQTVLADVPAGDYQLYLTDANGCESYYKTYTVNQTREYTVAEYGVVTADACNTGTGAITATTVTGGLPPYTYTWYNADKKTIGSGSSIANLAAGIYTLNVVDTRCGNVDITYTVGEEASVILAPSVSDIQLCSNGSALIMVNDAAANNFYRIYDDASSSTPIAEQKGGKFTVQVNSSRSYFISCINGTCESTRVEVKITVGLSVVNIVNTFTPNGDGINDYWKINNIENYPGAMVQVFTRYGQKVFESKGYGTPFNGTFNGKKLAAGVYYFIINLNSNCNILSGSLTLIR